MSAVPSAAGGVHLRALGVHLRALTPDDLDACHSLSEAVGWAHRREDWALVLGLGQGLAAIAEGELVGTAMWWAFGLGHASLGSIIVAPERQGVGIGKLLMQGLLEVTSGRSRGLIATEEGRPLYAKYGFVPAGTVLQHQGSAPAIAALPLEPGETLRLATEADLPVLAGLDEAATGLPRASVLAALLDRGEAHVLERHGVVAGFSVLRRHGLGWLIGPVAAVDDRAARCLIAHGLAARPGEFIRVDVPAPTGLGAWLTELGLPEVDTGLVMLCGERPAPPGPARLFALVNQALG
jgi:predicted N-acetyltransferase YhbS